MAKRHSAVGHADQPRAFGRLEVQDRSPERGSRVQHHPQVTAFLSGGDKQHVLRSAGQPPSLASKRLPQPVGQGRSHSGGAGADRHMAAVHRRQLDEPERVAVRLLEDPRPVLARQFPAAVIHEELGGRTRIQPAQPERRQTGSGEECCLLVVSGEDERNALGLQAPGGEQQGVR